MSAEDSGWRWSLKHHDQLDSAELYAILQLRSAVFVVEQTCVFLDIDGNDLVSEVHHLMAWQDDRLAGCLRLLDPSMQHGDAAIGRVATAAFARGSGLGHALMERAVRHCAELWPDHAIVLSAQAHLQRYYAQHGFVAYGEHYLEDDIPHVSMRRV